MCKGMRPFAGRHLLSRINEHAGAGGELPGVRGCEHASVQVLAAALLVIGSEQKLRALRVRCSFVAAPALCGVLGRERICLSAATTEPPGRWVIELREQHSTAGVLLRAFFATGTEGRPRRAAGRARASPVRLMTERRTDPQRRPARARRSGNEQHALRRGRGTVDRYGGDRPRLGIELTEIILRVPRTGTGGRGGVVVARRHGHKL